jgi:hypothetical protein
MLGKALFLLIASSLPVIPVFAQQVDCTVQVNYEGVSTTHKELLRDFASDISDYINNYMWGSDDLDAKVKCTINIFFKGAVGENRYSAQAFIGSQRRIYDTNKSSAVVRLFDENWDFTYVERIPIDHNLYSFNELTSFLDFYIYVILGYDYDSYEELGGTSMFQKAANVASLGRSSGQKGWQRTTGSYSRVRLIDEILNRSFAPVRSALYTYHFCGLDSLSVNPLRGYKNIIRSIQSIGEARRAVDPRNQFIKVFFDTKYLELADLFKKYPDQSVYAKDKTNGVSPP